MDPCGGRWCGFCYENVRGRASHRGHRGYRPPAPIRWGCDVLIRKASAAGRSAACSASLGLSGELATRFAAVGEFLTCSEWSKGVPRQTGSLLLCVDQGLLKVWVNDRDGERSAWVSGDSLEAVLDAVERGLREDRLDWRAQRGKGRRS